MTIAGYEAGAGQAIASRTYYIEDDWGDGVLSGRSSPTSGPWFYQPAASQPGDALVGRYRPEWVHEFNDGHLSVGSGSVSVNLNGNDGAYQELIVVDTDVQAGAWAFDFSWDSNGYKNVIFHAMYREAKSSQQSSNSWVTGVTANGGRHLLRKYNGGTPTNVLDVTWAADTNQHTSKTTRDDDGNWEMFMDGTSQGTASDTFLPAATYNAFTFYDHSNGADSGDVTELRVS